MTDDSFENQLPDDLKPIADALRESRAVADGHLLDRVLHRIRATSQPRPRLWLSVPRLAVMASLAVAVVIGAKLSHVNVVRGVATLAGSVTTTGSTSPTGSATCVNEFYVPSGCGAFTPGYWKNHQSATVALLPQYLGGYKVDTFTKATNVFKAMNCSNSPFTTQDAVGCLAGQLLAAELNVNYEKTNGLGTPACAISTIASANSFLINDPLDISLTPHKVGYRGPGNTYTLTSAQRTTAIDLANSLNNFNNGKPC